MGFDIYWCGEYDDSAYRAAREVFHEAARVRDAKYPRGTKGAMGSPEQAAVLAASAAMYAAEPWYFRANVWGMAKLCDAMTRVGMVHWHDEGQPSPPEWDGAAAEADEDGYGEAYDKACEPWRMWAPEYPGICGWKFGSNDGWIVTPIELTSALRILADWTEAHPGEHPLGYEPEADDRAWWQAWVDYLGTSAEHEGLEVH